MADEALKRLSRTFDRMYSKSGRPSIPPERLLKAMLLMALFSVRSERQFCEQLEYNLLFRWFLDMDMLEAVFDHCAFFDNRTRILEHDVAGRFFSAVVQQAKAGGLMSREHFSVDGSLIEAWASMKSFRRKDDDDDDINGWSDFRGEKRCNETHESKTDPEAKLMRKGNGQAAKLSFAGHALMENRSGLLVDVRVTEANGRCEREAAIDMLYEADAAEAATLGADAGYDAKSFVEACRDLGFTPHVAQKKYSAVDRRTTRHEVRGKPTRSEAHRASLGLDEDGRWASQDSLQRARAESAAPLCCRRCLQPAQDGTAHPATRGMTIERRFLTSTK
jgi:transposase